MMGGASARQARSWLFSLALVAAAAWAEGGGGELAQLAKTLGVEAAAITTGCSVDDFPIVSPISNCHGFNPDRAATSAAACQATCCSVGSMVCQMWQYQDPTNANCTAGNPSDCGCWYGIPYDWPCEKPTGPGPYGWVGRKRSQFNCDGGSGGSGGCIPSENGAYPDLDTCHEDPACPPRVAPSHGSPKGPATGTIILIIASLAGVIYLVAGILIGERHNKTGLDMIPHRAFWAALPGLIKDGFKLTFSKCGAGSQGGLGKFATSFAPYESL